MEFNSLYTPQGVIHDTNIDAAFITQAAFQIGRCEWILFLLDIWWCVWRAGSSFYTIPRRLWTGCQWLYYQADLLDICFLQKLEESEANCVYKDDNIVVLKRANGDYLGVAWNIARKSAEQGKEKMLLEFTFPAEQEGTASWLRR